LIYTFIIANLEDIVAQLDVTQTLFKKQLDNVKMYINMQNLDENIGGTILTYFDYLWIHQGGQNGNAVLDYMPKLLAEEVREEIVGHLVKDLFFVKDAHRDFVALFTNELLMTKYLPGDVLFYSGEIASALFFLYRGAVKLVSQTTGVEYTTVTNSVIGEGEFFMKSLQPCTAIAEDHAETFILTWDRFWRLVNEERALGEFKERLTTDGGLEYLEKNSISSLIERVKKNLAKSKKMQKMTENITEEEVFKYWVCEVDSNFRRFWDLFGLIFCVYYSAHLPFKMAFVGKIGASDLVVDVLAELFFVVDVYFRLQHFAVRYEGTSVRDRTVFRGLYVQKGGFFLDLVSVLPIFFIKFAAGGEDGGWVWMFSFNHFLRFRNFGMYLKNLIDSIEYFFAYRASTGAIRIGETFVVIATITHWTACIFFFLGRMYVEVNRESWLSLAQLASAEDLQLDDDTLRIKQYVTAIYWALYTISTTGYGNISLTQNGEKIFAMMVMITGAIICDAGITAVLTALIENKDHQAGTNSRRLDCAKKYMTHSMEGDEDEQNSVVEFFTYEDTELNNIDASAVLSKLSAPLRQSIISAHCEDILIASEAIGGFSRGVICSLMRLITTEVAIPGEVIIERGVKDHAFYILHSGRAKSVDDVGGKGTVQPGGIISNVEAKKREEALGLPAYSLRAVVYNAKNLPKTDLFGACDPYVEISYGKFGKVRTTVKKVTRHPVWHEIFYVKMTADVEEIRVKLYDWNRVEADELVGGFVVPIMDVKEEEDREYDLIGPDGKAGIGSVVMSLHHGRLAREQRVKTCDLTVTAETFCHLYKLENKHIEEYTEYLANLEKPPLERLPNLEVMENAIEEFKREQSERKTMSAMLAKSMRDMKLPLEEEGELRVVESGREEDDVLLDEDGLEIIRMKTEEFSESTKSLLDNLSTEADYDVAGPDSNLEGQGLFRKKNRDEGARDTIFKPRRTSIRKKGARKSRDFRLSEGKTEEKSESRETHSRMSFAFGFMRGGKGATNRESKYEAD
jgi:CRP-like cAMP-binding protein